MSLYEFEGKRPEIEEGAFVFESADIIGDVRIGAGCYVGPGARIRGDYGRVIIGAGTAVEENVVIHARPGEETVIGERVTVGHGAIIHNARVGDSAIIGTGSVVSDWARIGEWAVVAEGAVVANSQIIPHRAVAVGVPAKVINTISQHFEKEWAAHKEMYADLARQRYPEGLRKIK
jgi:carbonic anhydrase/acetyltransferase-like protein (isoleucine patch superfamily)